MFKKIIIAIKDGSFIKKVIKKIKNIYLSKIKKIFTKKIKVENDCVLFLTFQYDYTCNPKAICEELMKKNYFKIYWAIDDKRKISNLPKNVIPVYINTLNFYKIAAKCKFVIDNANNFAYLGLEKNNDQVLLQTWHGSMGFKRLDSKSVKNQNWVNKAMLMNSITDYCIVNSKFEEDVFKSSYWPDVPMLYYGHARNDILFNKNNEFEFYSKKIREIYNIDDDVKIVLFAPTFRDNSSLNSYALDYDMLLKALEKRFPGKWCILLRMHYKLKSARVPKKYLRKVINVTDYPDMQELLCAVDVGITDYSSWMCDFVLTGKPGFLFTLDIDKYINERGFYYPLESTPFPVASSNEVLYDKIVNFDEKKYSQNVKKFLKDKGCCETGYASKKIVELMFSIRGE